MLVGNHSGTLLFHTHTVPPLFHNPRVTQRAIDWLSCSPLRQIDNHCVLGAVLKGEARSSLIYQFPWEPVPIPLDARRLKDKLLSLNRSALEVGLNQLLEAGSLSVF